jgi:hypothetical protein
MNLRQAITAGAAGAGSLVLPAAAYATRKHMGPRFDATLHVRHDGLVIDAEGPVGDWTWDADYGCIAVVIVQGDTKGTGISWPVHRDDDEWHAPHVIANYHRFRPGSAMAHGVILIPDGHDAYSYAWSVPVQLAYR